MDLIKDEDVFGDNDEVMDQAHDEVVNEQEPEEEGCEVDGYVIAEIDEIILIVSTKYANIHCIIPVDWEPLNCIKYDADRTEVQAIQERKKRLKEEVKNGSIKARKTASNENVAHLQ